MGPESEMKRKKEIKVKSGKNVMTRTIESMTSPCHVVLPTMLCHGAQWGFG